MPLIRYPSGMNADASFDQVFWRDHPGLIWSNAEASDSQRIRAALMRPAFHTLLPIAVRFGIARLADEWASLERHADEQTRRAAPVVRRILKNISQGHALAAAGKVVHLR
jgi:hypothetical protein